MGVTLGVSMDYRLDGDEGAATQEAEWTRRMAKLSRPLVGHLGCRPSRLDWVAQDNYASLILSTSLMSDMWDRCCKIVTEDYL